MYDDVVSRLAAAPVARRAVAPDWRGHGETPLGADDFGQDELVGDTIGLLDELGIQTVIPVAVAHAGWVAIELRRLLGPERVPGVVLLDWMVLGAPEPFMGALAGLQHPGSWQQVRAALFGMWTEGVDVPAVHECVERMGRQGFAMWSRAAREIEAAFTAEPVPLAGARRARLPDPAPLRPAGRPGVPRRSAGVRRRAPVVRGRQARRPQSLPDGRGPRPRRRPRRPLRRGTSVVEV